MQGVAQLSKRPDGALVWDCDWNFFSQEWKKAKDHEKVQMEDGRPAVRREPASRHELPSYVAPEMNIWRMKRDMTLQEWMHSPPPSRVRLCRVCTHEMKVKQELSGDWIFRCPRCGGTEILSKQLVGGTIGAGETEKT